MRQLNTIGFMHNRARLITSNFLNRILSINWRLGEKYYAQKLIDYDPAVNNGNWQWVASVGVDTKPFQQRIFNPWTQSKKYDSDAIYIKKWIPELQNIPSKHLHKWDKYYHLYDVKYPKPIVDYKKARSLTLQIYNNR
jgi:deoxyribodipyrimidine photo-lyase